MIVAEYRLSVIETVLGRSEFELQPEIPAGLMSGEVALITGAAGSVGGALAKALRRAGVETVCTDVDELDVTDPFEVNAVLKEHDPDVIFHLAGMKHAPLGEDDPGEAVRVNYGGTANVLAWRPRHATRVVLASTCKACNPETAYGASKLLAEKLTLNAGQAVARFHNVVETSGNVFEIWGDAPWDEPLAVTPCNRFFISLQEAVALLMWSAVLPPARYGVMVGPLRPMWDVAARLYPGRELRPAPPRRGDRLTEPFIGSHETYDSVFYAERIVDGLMRVRSPHDPLQD